MFLWLYIFVVILWSLCGGSAFHYMSLFMVLLYVGVILCLFVVVLHYVGVVLHLVVVVNHLLMVALHYVRVSLHLFVVVLRHSVSCCFMPLCGHFESSHG